MAQHWKKQASVAYGYALTRLVLNAYMFFEDCSDEYSETDEKQKELDSALMEMLNRIPQGSLTMPEVNALRGRLRAEMETAIACMDSFRIYEYALNRVERRFLAEAETSPLTDEEMGAQLIGYVISAENAAEMNQRIQEVIAQLPVRFTRQKFYGMVREALSAYIDSDQETLENMMYLLRTCGAARLSEEQRNGYPKFAQQLDHLKKLSFKDLTADAFHAAQEMIDTAGAQLSALSETLQTAAEMTNDMYIICLTREDAIRDASEETHAWGILTDLCRLYRDGVRQIPEEVEKKLFYLEGLQESYFEKYQRMDPAPEYREGEDETAGKMRCVEKLMSTSVFVELEESPKQEQAVTSKDIDKAVEGLVAELDPVFTSCQKPIMRAIMATMLSRLPICFNSVDEIREYIENSLGGCGDRAEKEACVELLQQLMENEDYALV